MKAAWRRQQVDGQELTLLQKVKWAWRVSVDSQKEYSSRDQFRQCGFKFSVAEAQKQPYCRIGMHSKLLKFLHDGDEEVCPGAVSLPQSSTCAGFNKCD